MIGARGRGKGGNFIEAGATRCRECVYLSPDAQSLSHSPQVTSEALPYWCILPLMHKVSHTLAIGLYLPRLDGCILPLMHRSLTPEEEAVKNKWDVVCILPLMHKVSHIVYIVAHAISNMCSMVCRHLM